VETYLGLVQDSIVASERLQAPEWEGFQPERELKPKISRPEVLAPSSEPFQMLLMALG
jgi:hypothetical protein